MHVFGIIVIYINRRYASTLLFLFLKKGRKTRTGIVIPPGVFGGFRMSVRIAILLCAAVSVLGCTQSVPSQFKLLPASQSVDAGFVVGEDQTERQTSPVDILWVIDNSASMAPSQSKLKAGLAAFAKTYFKGDTDIQLAVITTDAFVANPLWEKYLATPLPGRKDTPRTYVNPRTGRAHTEWGSDYARLTSAGLMKTRTNSLARLTREFESRVDVGTDGIYEEHGFDSVEQFMVDNEKSTDPKANKLFRKGSQRIIVFLSDEDDQSMDASSVGPEPRKLLFSGSYYTGKDQAKADAILPAHFTIDCPTSEVGGKTLAPMSICLRPGLVTPVETVKSRLDLFFRELDGSSPSTSPNYLVASIVSKDLNTIEYLRANSGEKAITHERGDRYLKLADLVGGGSFSMDIGSQNYTKVLEKIGLEVVKHSTVPVFAPQTTFKLERAPDMRERIVVTLEHASGERTVLKSGQYSVTANVVKITDPALISVMKAGDRIFVTYQPSTVLPAK